MGADLILSWTRLPHDATGQTVKWNDATEAEMRRRIAAFEFDTLCDLADQCGWDDPEGNPEIEAEIRERILDAAKAVIQQADSPSRNVYVTSFDDPARAWVLAGGTSWGDSPGEDFDEVSLIAMSDLFHDDLT